MSKAVRVVFCTHPSIYSDIVLAELIEAEHIQLVGIVESTRILRKRGWSGWDSLLMLYRTGIYYATYLFFITSLYSALAVLSGRKTRIRNYLQEKHIPILQTRDINNPDGRQFIRNCAADIMLSAHFNQLIKQELLELPQHGCLNIHPGNLPAYKGVDPAFYALLRKEKEAEVTVHFQDKTFDTGHICTTRKISISTADSLTSLNLKLFKTGVHALLDLLTQAEHPLPRYSQPHSDVYDSWPDRNTIKAFHHSGKKLLELKSYLTSIFNNN